MKKWDEQFFPVMKSLGYGTRDQQRVMGQGVIDTLESGGSLMIEAPTGVGKSYGVLVPLVHKILASKAVGRSPYRAVVATATKSLQSQYEGDLAVLKRIFPGFSHATLYGRDNYLCFNSFKSNMYGNPEAKRLFKLLDPVRASLGMGERKDIDKVVGYPLTDQEWRWMSGSAKGCAKAKCDSGECFSKKARDRALNADLVITNNAILRVDADSASGTGLIGGERFLGDVNCVVVDEAHELESSLISGWTEEITQWELDDLTSIIQEGVDCALGWAKDPNVRGQATDAAQYVSTFLETVVDFFEKIHAGEQWRNVSDSLSLKYISGRDPSLISAMNRYESDGVSAVLGALTCYEQIEEYLSGVVKENKGQKGLRKISKGLTAVKNLRSLLSRVEKSLGTKDGVVMDFGVPYTLLVEGIEKRNGEKVCKIVSVPMDISSKAMDIWKDRTAILMSATLRDLSRSDFSYVHASLGLQGGKELVVDSVFDMKKNQVVYVTPGSWDKEDVPGAWFSAREIAELIRAGRGRALVLFTSRKELEHAAEYLEREIGSEYPLIVQTREANKSMIADEFRAVEDSVLLATKSFFAGVNFPGSGLSHVIIAKFPLPQYNTLCKNQISWWAKRGFRDWYESRALEVFQQAQGRLLRTETDRGVVSLVDQRVTDPGQKVCATALKAVQLSGSAVVRSVADVRSVLD